MRDDPIRRASEAFANELRGFERTLRALAARASPPAVADFEPAEQKLTVEGGFIVAHVGKCICVDGWTSHDRPDGYSEARRCGICGPATLAAATMTAARLPGLHVDSTFDNYKPSLDGDGPEAEGMRRDAVATLRQFARQPTGHGIILGGKPGRGKTHLIVATLRELALWKTEDVRYVSLTQTFAAWRKLSARDRAAMCERLWDAGVLAVDELGAALPPWEVADIEALFVERHNTGRPTLVATNYPLHGDDSLEGRLAAHVLSRLGAMTYCPLVGPDARTG